MTTSRASLCALGESLTRHCFFAPLREQVQSPQKTVRYRPSDKLLDGLRGLLCGAKTIAQSPITIRIDPAVQRACGRTGCAEQSTIARTLQASTAETVDHLSRVSWYDRKRYGQPPHHRFAERLWWIDVDVTPLPIGVHAEGSERTWMGRNRSKTGRKILRWTASEYREILHETLRRGKASAVPALQTALSELETRLGWTRERRQRIVLRLAGGCGTTDVLNWLLSRGSQGVAKISHSGRVRKVRQALGPWQPTSSPGREVAMVLCPYRFCRTTQQWVLRTPKEKGGYQYAVLVTPLTDDEPAALADAYDGRAMIEATFCQDKQAFRARDPPSAPVGGATEGRAVGPLGASSARVGQAVAESGAVNPTAVTGLWMSAVAAGCLGGAGGHPVAARLEGQCTLRTPSSTRNAASGKLFRAVSRACPGGIFALKTGSWPPIRSSTLRKRSPRLLRDKWARCYTTSQQFISVM
jgi:hypothetical protein